MYYEESSLFRSPWLAVAIWPVIAFIFVTASERSVTQLNQNQSSLLYLGSERSCAVCKQLAIACLCFWQFPTLGLKKVRHRRWKEVQSNVFVFACLEQTHNAGHCIQQNQEDWKYQSPNRAAGVLGKHRLELFPEMSVQQWKKPFWWGALGGWCTCMSWSKLFSCCWPAKILTVFMDGLYDGFF